MCDPWVGGFYTPWSFQKWFVMLWVLFVVIFWAIFGCWTWSIMLLIMSQKLFKWCDTRRYIICLNYVIVHIVYIETNIYLCIYCIDLVKRNMLPEYLLSLPPASTPGVGGYSPRKVIPARTAPWDPYPYWQKNQETHTLTGTQNPAPSGTQLWKPCPFWRKSC